MLAKYAIIKYPNARWGITPMIMTYLEIYVVRRKKVKIQVSALDKTNGFSYWSIDIYTVLGRCTALRASPESDIEVRNKDGSILKKTFYRDDLLKFAQISKVLEDHVIMKMAGVIAEEIVFASKPKVDSESVLNEPNQ